MDPIVTIAIIIAVSVAAAVVATLMGYLRIILGISAVMKINTKCMAIGWRYLYRENMDVLYECKDIGEVAVQIASSGYKISGESADEAEKDVEKELVRMLNEIRMSAPESLRPLLEAYILKYDAMMVKRIITAKHAGIPKNRIYKEVYPVNVISKTIIEHMVESEKLDDAIHCLDATPFNKCIEVWDNSRDIVKFEHAIDRVFFDRLKAAATMSDDTVRDAVKRFVGVLIDSYNLKTAFRCKFMGVRNAEEYIIDGGRELSLSRLKPMLETESIDRMLVYLEGTSYHKFLQDVPPDISEIERCIDRALLRILEEIYGTFSNSAGPTLRFLVAKEYEARNIKAVIRGIKNNVPHDMYERVITL